MSIRIILADDHKIMREGLRALLSKQPHIEVIAEAGNGRGVVDLARELNPDVVVIDIAMPDLNGIDATRQIIKESPGVKEIALSMHSDRKFVKEMLSAGASGYLLKDAVEELSRALHAVCNDHHYLSPELTMPVRDVSRREVSGVPPCRHPETVEHEPVKKRIAAGEIEIVAPGTKTGGVGAAGSRGQGRPNVRQRESAR